MFSATYKNTLKTLVRSTTFRLLFVLFILEIIKVITEPSYGYYDLTLQEMITDTDSRFVVGFGTYLKETFNAGVSLKKEILPLITAVATVLVLNRDYGDNFYEIEKAAGIKPRHYLWARLTALATLLIGLGAVFSLVNFHVYIFTRGGVPSMDLFTYITDSTFRLLRSYLFVSVPVILFYIAFTYCMGALFKNGIAAAVISLGYVIFNSAVNLYRMPAVYKYYLSPSSMKLTLYIDATNRPDKSEVAELLQMNDTDLGKAALCLCILVGLAVVYSVVAYLRTRKRDR